MSVFGTRLPSPLEEKVHQRCRKLGKTPSQWLRELVRREIEGKEPFSFERLAPDLERNAELLQSLVVLSAMMYKMLCLMVTILEGSRVWRIEQLNQKFWESFSGSMLKKGVLSLEAIRELNWLVTEIEKLEREIYRGQPTS